MFLDHRPIAARPVGPLERAAKWARRHPGRAVALAAALLVAVGAVVAANEVEKRRAADRRETRADALVGSLAGADTAALPALLKDLNDVRDLIRPRLREMAAGPIDGKPGLHAHLALPADEPEWAAELAHYLPSGRPEEPLTIRRLLEPHPAAVPLLWAVLNDPTADPKAHTRAACGLAADDPRWDPAAPAVVEGLLRATPDEFVAWAPALHPVRGVLLPVLQSRYAESQAKLAAGLAGDAVGEVTGFNLAAELIARHAADRSDVLAEMAMTAADRHYPLYDAAIRANAAAVTARLRDELDVREPPFAAAAAVAGGPAATAAAVADHAHVALTRRQAFAAATLATLGDADPAWARLRHTPDPTLRSYLTARLAAVGVTPVVLMRRFRTETDVSARRALVIALGDYDLTAAWAAERAAFADELLGLYRTDHDPGLHSAIDWLRRRKWDRADAVRPADAALKAEAVAGGDPAATDKDWFVSRSGLTFAVVRPPRRPAQFVMGSPLTEPFRRPLDSNIDVELRHARTLPRPFAIATREVTRAEFEEFWATIRLSPFPRNPAFIPSPDGPALAVPWHVAARFRNWLSDREHIPAEQPCYERTEIKQIVGIRVRPGHLDRAGYRLPTEAEWEYACRAGSEVARYFGRAEDLLPRYAWHQRNSGYRSWPVGLLRPNDLGLFDSRGNASEWVDGRLVRSKPGQPESADVPDGYEVEPRSIMVFRGGSFNNPHLAIRAAVRLDGPVADQIDAVAFRLARTLPEAPPAGP